MVDSFDKVERITENVCESIKKEADTAIIPTPVDTPAKVQTLADLFGEELDEKFRCTESGDGMYAGISMEAEGMKQQYLVFISTADKGSLPVQSALQ